MSHLVQVVDARAFIRVVTLNRLEAHNALNRDVLKSLLEALEHAASNEQIRCLIITGAGDRAFCAGADLKERRDMSIDDTHGFLDLINAVCHAIAQLPMPTIAAINGVAFGGGLELALACDLRVIAPHAQVGLTECALGIIPGAGGTQRLPQLVGLAKAKELIFSSQRLKAQEAVQMGLANCESDGETTLETALSLASRIAKCAPLAVRAAKKAMQGTFASDRKYGLELERACYDSILHSQDRLEGLAAFAEKRQPTYLGK